MKPLPPYGGGSSANCNQSTVRNQVRRYRFNVLEVFFIICLALFVVPWILGGNDPRLNETKMLLALAVIAAHLAALALARLPKTSFARLIIPCLGLGYLLLVALSTAAGRELAWSLITLSFATALGCYGIALLGRSFRAAASDIPARAGPVTGWSRNSGNAPGKGLGLQLQDGEGRLVPDNLSEGDLARMKVLSPYHGVKRALDLLTALALLPLVATVIVIAAIAVRLDTPGPAIFVHRREGWRGRGFKCFKIRTMLQDSNGPPFTLAGDSRITKVGRVLRKWHIDELPQIVNVIAGQMSWIGPRPESFELAREYARQIPQYHLRRSVRPGVSGWAAVHQGNVGSVNAAREKLQYDSFYVRHISFRLDVLIVFKTLRAIAIGVAKR